MVMLPTQLENERAIGMYYRRGWQLTITDPQAATCGWCASPPGFYEKHLHARPGAADHVPPRREPS
jgi:hypothetical protein